MGITTITPTLGNTYKLENLLKSLQKQTIKPQKTILLLDKKINNIEKQEFLYFFQKNFSDLNIIFVNNLDFDFQPQRGVSYVRNFGLEIALKNYKEDDYICLIDDDIVLYDDKTFEKALKIYENKEKNFLLFPSVINSYSQVLEHAGVKKVSPWSLKIKLNFSKNTYIPMCSSQFIFGPAKIFTNFRYDERFRFVYEDLDFSKNITKIGIKIFVPENIKVFHYDKKTNPAKRSYVANPFLAYEKGKNRMLFVKKHFNFWEKLIFYSVGIWIHTLRSLLLIIIRGENKWNSIKAFIKGSIKGLTINKRISINSHLPNNSF